MRYVLGFAVEHVELFRPCGRHLCEVVRLRNGIAEVMRAVFLRHMASEGRAKLRDGCGVRG